MTDLKHPFKVRKKGKTRGRRSRAEKLTEQFLAWWWEKNKKDWEAAYWRMVVLGETIILNQKTGKIQSVPSYVPPNEWYGTSIVDDVMKKETKGTK